MAKKWGKGGGFFFNKKSTGTVPSYRTIPTFSYFKKSEINCKIGSGSN